MNIAVLLYNGVLDLDALGTFALLQAGALAQGGEHEVYTLARSRHSVTTASGLVITPHRAFMSAPEPEVLVLPGGDVDAQFNDRAVMGYLAQHAPTVPTLLCVGTGAFLLGELGLAKDLRATTWAGARDRLYDYEVGDILDEDLIKNDNARYFTGSGARAQRGVFALLAELFGAAAAAKVQERLEL